MLDSAHQPVAETKLQTCCASPLLLPLWVTSSALPRAEIAASASSQVRALVSSPSS